MYWSGVGIEYAPARGGYVPVLNGDLLIAVTYCPLCNSAVVYERTVQGRTLEFSVTGMLRHRDMVMWDRQTQTWWQQLTGEAITGGGTNMTGYSQRG